MAIPESQLETWSHQGAITTAKSTADSIKNALNSYSYWPNGVDFEVYLQGSYKNDTNIRGDSDVDVVAQLNSTFYSDLTEDQKRVLGFSPASYSWSNFKSDVLMVLRNYYGQSSVTEGNKSLKISASYGRLPADVVVCAQYKKYRSLNANNYVPGICFWTRTGNRQVINYPKVHYDNGVSNHQISNKWYKPIVRLFKNSRSYISGDATPSYFLECMLYNVPNSYYGSSYQNSFCNIVDWLNNADLTNFVCQNEQLRLFGLTQEQWNINEAKKFINDVISLWNNW